MLPEEEQQQQQQSPALTRCEKQLGYTEEGKAHFKRSRYIETPVSTDKHEIKAGDYNP
jgi:hypothetical protein